MSNIFRSKGNKKRRFFIFVALAAAGVMAFNASQGHALLGYPFGSIFSMEDFVEANDNSLDDSSSDGGRAMVEQAEREASIAAVKQKSISRPDNNFPVARHSSFGQFDLKMSEELVEPDY